VSVWILELEEGGTSEMMRMHAEEIIRHPCRIIGISTPLWRDAREGGSKLRQGDTITQMKHVREQ
jgi:hypothetical protein